MNSNNRRGQSGVDMVMTYGWIFVVGIGAVIIMSQMGTFHPAPVEKTKYGFSQLMPIDWGVYMDSNCIVAKIENWAGDKVNITKMQVTIGDVSCDSSGTLKLLPGDSAVIRLDCSASPSLSDKFIKGSAYTAEVTITYVDVASGVSYVSKGTVRGPVEEGSVTTTTIIPYPDLTITSVYESGVGDIRYIINNPSSDMDAPASISSVLVYDKNNNPLPGFSTSDPVPAIVMDGGSSDEDTTLRRSTCPTPGENYIVKVCADGPNLIDEGPYGEGNNCGQNMFFCPGPDQPPVVELISPRDCYDESNVNRICHPPECCDFPDGSCPC
jgi:hypothetical protein